VVIAEEKARTKALGTEKKTLAPPGVEPEANGGQELK